MKTIKPFRFAVFAAAVALAAAGCEKGPEKPERPAENQDDIEFTATAEEITNEGATVTISHNGSAKETYYGFCYDDVSTSVDAAVNRKVAELTKDGADLSGILLTGKSYMDVLKGLEAKKTYRYVVFGLNADGTTYGTTGSCEFTTSKSTAKFELNVINTTENSATLTVKSSGDAEDTYYCFYTTDLTSSVADVVKAEVAKLGGNVSSVLKSGNQTLQFTGLDAGAKYRAVVTGLLSDGTVYGSPVEAAFSTSKGENFYQVNPAWTVTYRGKGTSQGKSADMIKVTSTSTDRFFTGVIETAEFDKIGIETYIDDMVEQMEMLLEYYGATWKDVTYTASSEVPYNVLDSSVEFYAFAIGVDLDGNATGLYAQSEKFIPEELEASEAYKKWLGTWTMGNETKSYQVKISALSPDISYSVDGYEGGGKNTYPPFEAGFDSETGELLFYGNEDLADVTVTIDQAGTQVDCSLGFFASGADKYVYPGPYDIATAKLFGDSKATVNGVTLEFKDGSTVDMVSMQYWAIPKSGGNSVYRFGEVPAFPLTMTKVNTTASSIAVAKHFQQSGLRSLSPLKMYHSSSMAVR